MSDEYFSAPGAGVTAQPVWELSGWWRRVGASVIDSLIVWIPVSIVVSLFDSGSEFTAEDGSASFNLDTSGTLLALVASAIYFMVVMSAWNGQTVGKKVTGIRVVRENGENITAGFAFVRQTLVIQILFGMFAALLLFIPTLLNYLWPLWDDKHQALHDKIVKTRVVRAEPVGDPGALQQAQQQFAQAPGTAPFPQAPQAPPPPQAPPAAPPQAPYQPPVAPPPPPPPGGAAQPYTPPPGFENPVPDEDK